ncbi:hypothetical protein A2U01_0049713 [Trifolium medium]|uniref:Uncharacterized protein n=1 Tax=Trifolium medium TaxID=97028 RepID=A0A392QXA0_9FABA|nr:hypothetical protein [Trifolium medium]
MARRTVESADPDIPLEVARRAGWFGAVRQYKNSNLSGVTANCASRRTDGAARRYGKLCKNLCIQ